jgi:uncharacterized phiE125 gp8 family phage protein
MTPILVSAPIGEPVALAAAKSWLKVDGTDEDGVIQTLIVSARLAVEAATNRLLMAQQWRVVLDQWPASGALRLPLTPVRGVSRIRIFDASGGGVDVAPSFYTLIGNMDRAHLVLGAAPPSPVLSAGGIGIDLMVGYADSSAVPEALRLAMLRLIALWHSHRGDDVGAAAPTPAEVSALLAPWRVRRLA